VVEEHLLADAKPEEGLAARALPHRVAEAGFLQRAHAVGHRALPGEHHAIGRAHARGIRGDLHFGFGRDVLQRFLHGAQVAHAVIHDRDALPGHGDTG
jgi:hypothetical protein